MANQFDIKLEEQLPPLSALRNPRRKRRFRVPIPTGSLLRAARPPESRWRRRHAYCPAAARRWPFRTWQESPISPVGKWFWSRSGIVRSAVCFWALWMTRLLRCTGRKANHTSFMTGKKKFRSLPKSPKRYPRKRTALGELCPEPDSQEKTCSGSAKRAFQKRA